MCWALVSRYVHPPILNTLNLLYDFLLRFFHLRMMRVRSEGLECQKRQSQVVALAPRPSKKPDRTRTWTASKKVETTGTQEETRTAAADDFLMMNTDDGPGTNPFCFDICRCHTNLRGCILLFERHISQLSQLQQDFYLGSEQYVIAGLQIRVFNTAVSQ